MFVQIFVAIGLAKRASKPKNQIGEHADLAPKLNEEKKQI